MNNTRRPVFSNHPKDRFYRHPKGYLRGSTDHLRGETAPVFQLDDCKNIRCLVRKLVACRSDHRIGNNFPPAGTVMINDSAVPPAIRAERAGWEEDRSAGLASRSNQVISLGDLPPETCYCHSLHPPQEMADDCSAGTADILGHPDLSSVNLPLPGLSTKLGNNLPNLFQPCRTNRMSTRFQTA